MAIAYIPDELIARVLSITKDKNAFVKEAIEEKLEKEKGKKVV